MAETLFHILLPEEWQKAPITPEITSSQTPAIDLTVTDGEAIQDSPVPSLSKANIQFSTIAVPQTIPPNNNPNNNVERPVMPDTETSKQRLVESNTSENQTLSNLATNGMAPVSNLNWKTLQNRLHIDSQMMQPAEIIGSPVDTYVRSSATRNLRSKTFSMDSPAANETDISRNDIEQIVDQKLSSLKVYVLESEITEAQKAVKSVVELASF